MKILMGISSMLLLFLSAGCSTTTQRAALISAGAAAAGALGNYASRGHADQTLVTAASAVVGAGLAAVTIGEDKATYQKGVDAGYQLGNADATKRLYFLKQSLERQREDETKMRYYVYDAPTETADGRRLVPEKIAVPIVEPK